MRMKVIAAVLIVLALLGAGAGLLVSAPGGQRFLTDRITRALGGGDQTITVKEVGGEWPFHIIWTGIAVSDREGVWLTLDRLELRLRPGALLTGGAEIDSAVAGTAHMLRQPAGTPNRAPSPPPTVDAIARALKGITVREARVGILLLDPPVMGRQVDATLTASLQDDPASKLHTLSLDGRLRSEPGSIALKFAAGRNAAVVQVNAAAETVTAAGAITINNRSNALSGALKLNCRGETVCFAWPSGRIGAVTADLALAGTLQSPEGRIDFRAQDLAFDARKLTALEGQISARPKAEAPQGVIAITGAGTATGVPEALPEGRPLVGEAGKWSFGLSRSPDGTLVLDAAALETGDASAQIAGLGLTPKLTPATLKLSLKGGGRFLGLSDSVSRTDASLRVDRLDEGGVGAGHLSLVLTGLPPAAGIRPLLQDHLNLEADIALGAGQVSFTNIAARSGGAAIRGASAWARAPRFDHTSSALTVILPPGATILPEPTQADVTLKGPLATLHAEISATAPVILLSRAPVRDAVVAVALDRTPAGFAAALDGNGQWIDGPLAFSAKVSQTEAGIIDVAGITWKSPATDLSGGLQIATETGHLTGGLNGPVSDLVPLTTAFGAASAGSADVTAAFSAAKDQRLDVTLAGHKVENAALVAETLSFTGRFDDLFGDVRISTRATATGARLFDRPLAAFNTRADGDLNALKVVAEARGAGDTPFALTSATDIAFGASTTIAFQRLAGQDGDLKVALLAPTQLTVSADAMTLAPTRVSVNDGELQAGFTWNKVTDIFEGAFHAQKVSLPAFTAIPGQTTSMIVSGDVTLAGPMNAVNGAANLTGTLPGTKDQPPLALSAVLALNNGRARVNATAGGLSREPAFLTADVPARLDLAAARFALITTEPVSGTLKWAGSLTPLWRLIPSDVNVLAGDVTIDASLSGTLDAPVLAGAFNLTNGTYESLVGGTALRNIEAAIGGDERGGFTLFMKAQDMNDGNVTLSGRIANDEKLTADITADMSRLDVLHRDDVIAAATGKITYTGPFAAGQFKGNVQMVNSLVRLGGSYMPDIPLLRALPGFEPVRNDGMFAGITLDIGVTTSNPMRIEGQGLDSLWRGQMNVVGSLSVPDVRGTLTLDRGSFSFLGQSFTLDSGTVTFTGGGTIDPQLNIVAVREASDITATVNITGRARAPAVQLTSRPALPRDEILARLLFRKGTGELGPIESIQLASAASDLAGISNGGINGVLRRTLGVDVSAGAEGNSVMVGRQIGRNLYVSVGQSLTEQEREIVVEWRLSRSFSLKSTTSDVTGADIGVFWRKDY
ncbi:MAG: translocation/assembly module TamB domain-containing protein [Rhodospirillaceae bacterium]|nr:translocation/assembly module TamB domain-containing protein [Rhodospirillaceae bacterium]